MEPPTLPPLTWIPAPVPDCLACGGEVQAEEIDLEVEAERSGLFRMEAGRCTHCGRWYGVLGNLAEILTHLGEMTSAKPRFVLGGRTLDFGIWLGPEHGLLDWEGFQTVLMGLVTGVDDEADPPPSAAEVRALDRLPEAWEVGVRVAAWIGEPGRAEPSYFAIVLDGQGMIRGNRLHVGQPHSAEALAAMVLTAAARPDAMFDAGRPRVVYVGDAEMAAALGEQLSGSGIDVRQGPTERVEAALAEAVAAIGPPQAPYFRDQPEKEVRAYFKAAGAFYRARPWKRFRPDQYIAFRFDGGPWRYVSVMGQMEEEPGLSIFDDWLQLCRLLHNTPVLFEAFQEGAHLKPLRAAGAVEGMTLSPLDMLHPEDAVYLMQLGIRPQRQGYPLPLRHTPDGPEPPSLDLRSYRLLMRALLETISRRRADLITSIKQRVELEGTEIVLRFPARGDEDLPEQPEAYRIIIHGAENDSPYKPLPPGTWMEIEAPGHATLEEIARALRREDNLFIYAFGAAGASLWTDGPRGVPGPRVAHLAGHGDLWSEVTFGSPYPMEVTLLPGAKAPPGIQITWLGG